MNLGLYNEVLPVEGFDDAVFALARSIAAGPAGAYGAAKTLMNQAVGADRLDYHLDQELEALVRSADSPEFSEGLRAFFEKRPARFPGGS